MLTERERRVEKSKQSEWTAESKIDGFAVGNLTHTTKWLPYSRRRLQMTNTQPQKQWFACTQVNLTVSHGHVKKRLHAFINHHLSNMVSLKGQFWNQFYLHSSWATCTYCFFFTMTCVSIWLLETLTLACLVLYCSMSWGKIGFQTFLPGKTDCCQWLPENQIVSSAGRGWNASHQEFAKTPDVWFDMI